MIFVINWEINAFNISEIVNNFNKFSFKRDKRQIPLLHNGRIATYQFITGFGVPVDNLQYETITSGMVFKFQYFLPTQLKALKYHSTTNVKGRDGEAIKFEFNKFYFYQLLELWLSNPFSTSDESVRHLNNSQEWINKITNSGSSTCDDIFKQCPKSALSIFTEIVDYL
uniref:Uncharacterized protein n=1 Tax=Glossina pallidipes TaxID=7398 RepID=A0A1B0AJP1_GLOPL